MKSFLLLALLGMAVVAESPQANENPNQGLEAQIETELVFNEMVHVFDYEGNLMREFYMSEVANGDITVTDHILLEKSDYAFNYLGDHYYFSAEKERTVN